MAINYTTFFDITKTYAKAYQDTLGNITDIETIKEYAVSKLVDADQSVQLTSALNALNVWIGNETGSGNTFGLNQLGDYLLNDGKQELQSTSNTSAAVAADLVTFMTRDAQTVLENGIGQSEVRSAVGDGVVTLTQDQQTKNDVLTLSCVVGGAAAEFTVFSAAEGDLTSAGNLDADGVDSITEPLAGIVSLTITAGGSPWAVSDVVTLTTTSDDVSMLLITFRDKFKVLLPNSAGPTISNTL